MKFLKQAKIFRKVYPIENLEASGLPFDLRQPMRCSSASRVRRRLPLRIAAAMPVDLERPFL
jgi:hypothetical protein